MKSGNPKCQIQINSNSLKKLHTYYCYLFEYLKHGDFISIFAAIKYLFLKKSHSKDRIIQTSVGKFFCRKNTNDFQFANYHYEWGVKKYILDHISEYSVFIDGGACIGEYCVLLSGHEVRCIAFEPVKSNFDTLCKNLALNNLNETVMAFPFGLGERNAVANFVFNPVNTGASFVSSEIDYSDCTSEIRTFDDVLPMLKLTKEDRILFKLDVEGMEIEVIKGAAKFIRNFPNITFILEDKHSGKEKIIDTLITIAGFEFGTVDEYNLFARRKTAETR
jgi:FkbM family methyltransferase